MKKLVLSLIILLPFASFAQVINGSFENLSGADLSNWEWTCNAIPFNNAPPGGGSWSMQVFGGNLQGCFPGYAYQKIPSITDGQQFTLSAWVEATSVAGISFGVINNGVITLQAGDTTSSLTWQFMSLQSSFSINAGDTAVVVLFGGISTGPMQDYGFFDLVDLQIYDGISAPESDYTIQIFPNPVFNQLTLRSAKNLSNANLILSNSLGQTVHTEKNIFGNIISMSLDKFPSGIYVLKVVQEGEVISSKKIIFNER